MQTCVTSFVGLIVLKMDINIYIFSVFKGCMESREFCARRNFVLFSTTSQFLRISEIIFSSKFDRIEACRPTL